MCGHRASWNYNLINQYLYHKLELLSYFVLQELLCVLSRFQPCIEIDELGFRNQPTVVKESASVYICKLIPCMMHACVFKAYYVITRW